jgi:hypothetical protein
LPGSLGLSFCINCNLYGYNYKHFLRIFLTVDSGTCSSQLALDTDFLGIQTKLSHTLSMIASVTLSLPVRPFPRWQMQPLSRNCSYHLWIDNTGEPWRPNCRQNARWTATTLLLLANSSTHQLHCWKGSHFVKRYMLFPRDGIDSIKAIPSVPSLRCIWHEF